MREGKSIWLSEGLASDGSGKPLSYNITLENVNIKLSNILEFNQTHLSMNTEDIILLRNAIDKRLKEDGVFATDSAVGGKN